MAADSKRTQGIHGGGTTKYTAEQSNIVWTLITLGTMFDTPYTVADLHDATGLEGNTIRAIVRDGDGTNMILGGNANEGYRLAANEDDANEYTERLENQIRAMRVRIDRRRSYFDTASKL